MRELQQKCRRQFLARGIAVLAGIPVVTLCGKAFAGTASKSDFHYQDHPNNGKRCQDCTEFLPAAQPTSAAACRIVGGTISPDGWCMAYTHK